MSRARSLWQRLIGLDVDRYDADDAADWIERAQPGDTPILGGIVGTQDADGSTVVLSDDVPMYGHGATPGAAMRDYADSLVELRAIEYGDAFGGKPAIRRQLATSNGECGDGPEPPDWWEWSR